MSMGGSPHFGNFVPKNDTEITKLGCLASGITGLVAQHLYMHYEPSLKQFSIHTAVLHSALVGLQIAASQGQGTALICPFVNVATYFFVLGICLTVYRLFLHPLQKFPGPWYAKLTKWTTVYYSSSGYLHLWLPEMHRKYGEIVRVGPNELSFSSPADVKYIHGPQGARLEKGPYYDGAKMFAAGGNSMPATRDWEDHKIRRRIWDHGFSQKQLKSYEPNMLALMDIFLNNMKRLDGQTIDFGAWCDRFTFDAMGVLAFDYRFNMMSEDGPHDYSKYIRSGMRLMHIASNIPWVCPIVRYLPLQDANTRKDAELFKDISQKQYAERRARGNLPNDLFSHLIEGNRDGYVTSETDLEADSPALFVAGSDTSSIVLSFLFYYLTRDKHVYNRLRAEIDRVWDGKSPLEGSAVGPQQAPYLHGAIYETMRLSPPGPNGMQRRTPAAGHDVGGTRVPPFTQISSNTLALQHSEKNFTQPLDFIPERWDDATRNSSWNHDVRAFLPFTSGTFACAGRALAMIELRLFTVKVMRHFDVTMPADFDHAKWWANVKSYQSMIMGPLQLKVQSRKESSKKEIS